MTNLRLLWASHKDTRTNLSIGYSCLTSTNIKLVLVVSDPTATDRDIRKLFRTIHDTYVRLVCNPFYKPDTNIESKQFDAAIEEFLAAPAKQ